MATQRHIKSFLNQRSAIEEAKRLIIYKKGKLDIVKFLLKNDKHLCMQFVKGYFTPVEVLNTYLNNHDSAQQ